MAPPGIPIGDIAVPSQSSKQEWAKLRYHITQLVPAARSFEHHKVARSGLLVLGICARAGVAGTIAALEDLAYRPAGPENV